MEIYLTSQTPSTYPCPTSDLGMPARGRQSLIAGERQIPATGLSTTGVATDLRDRAELAAKGHVAFVADVPGILAWSPPIC